MFPQALAANGHHLCHQQAGDDAVLLRHMAPDRQPGTLFSADGDLVLIDQLANVLEADGRLVEWHLVFIGQSIDEVGRRHALGHAVAPAATLHQVVEQQRNHVVRLDEGSVGIHNAKAVRIAIGRNTQRRARLAHLRFAGAQQMVIRLWRMPAEQHIAIVVDAHRSHTVLLQDLLRIPAPRAPEWIGYDLQLRLGNGRQIHQLRQPLQILRLHVGGGILRIRCLRRGHFAQGCNLRFNLAGHLRQRRRAVGR